MRFSLYACSGDAAHRGFAAFPKLYFDEEKCGPGISALEHYHAKIDEDRQFSTGPEHDWSSHGSDALGLMAVSYRSPKELAAFYRPIHYPTLGII